MQASPVNGMMVYSPGDSRTDYKFTKVKMNITKSILFVRSDGNFVSEHLITYLWKLHIVHVILVTDTFNRSTTVIYLQLNACGIGLRFSLL